MFWLEYIIDIVQHFQRPIPIPIPIPRPSQVTQEKPMSDTLVGYCFLVERPGLGEWAVVARDKSGHNVAIISLWEDVSQNPYLAEWETAVEGDGPCGKRKLFLRLKKT
jgi:hypothetical protein